MAKEITLKISLDGASKVEAQIDDIGRGLHDLDVRDARNAKQALDRLDKTNLNHLQSEFRNTSKSIEDFGSTVKNVGQGLTSFGQQLTVGITLPIITGGVAAIKSFADVELAVANLSSIKPEIDTSKVFSALNEMSTRIPQSAKELGDGLYNIFSSINVTQAEGLQLLDKFGKGATAAQTDAKTFGTAVLGVMNAYKLSVADADHISDVFFNTVNLGVVNGQELAGQLGEVTQAAKNAGVGLDEMGALIVGVTKEGGNAAQNINNLSNFLMKLPTKESSKAIKELGVDVQSADGKFRPVIDVLGDLKTKLDAMTPSARALALQKIFPDAQARTGAQTLLSQLDSVKEALEVNKTTAGSANAAYQKIAATASVQFSLLKNTSIAILAELGSAILPLLQPLIIWLSQNLIPAVKQAVETFKSWSPAIKTVALVIVGIIAAIGPVLVVLGTVISFIGSVIIAIGAIKGAIAGIALTPVLLTIAATIAVVVAAFTFLAAHVVLIYEAWKTNFGGIRDFTNEVWTAIKQYIDVALAEINNLVNEVGGEVIAWWQENYPLIEQTVAQVSAAVKSIIQGFLAAVREFWQNHGQQIMSIVRGAWNIISNVVKTAVQLILQTIKLVMQIINGDWSGAWATFKDILWKTVSSIGVILKNLYTISIASLKLIVTSIINFGADIGRQSLIIGRSFVQGFINGMSSMIDTVISTAKSIIMLPINIFRSVPIIKSPSKLTTEIGEYIAEGLAIGMENKINRVKSAAKTLIDETIKGLKEAIKEFDKLAGASPDVVRGIQATNRIKDATSNQQEIIDLRAKLKLNNYQPLPNTVGDTEKELADLKRVEEAQKTFDESIQAITDSEKAFNEEIKRGQELLENKIQGIQNSGALDLINLEEQINLTGVVDDHEKERIKNYFEIIRLRQQMANDGFGQQQIDEAAQALKIEQSRAAEFGRILEIRKQVADATKLGEGLTGQLTQLQNGNRELTEYEKTLQKINNDLKDISPSQKEYLLNTAKQIDAQKQFNEQYQKTYDFIRSAFDVLASSGKSFGEKLKTIFAGIADKFKQMLLDMAARWITSKIFGGGGPQGGGGGFFGNILQILTGGGRSGSISGGGGGGIFSGNQGGGIFNYGTGTGSGHSQIFGAGGIGGTGGAGGVLSGGGILSRLGGLGVLAPFLGATLGAGLGGNRGLSGALGGLGGLLAGGIGTAALFPSIFGVGTAAGSSPLMAGLFGLLTNPFTIGVAGALLVGAFFLRRNAQRRRDEKTRNQGMLDSLDALKQFDSLIADVRALRINPATAIPQGETLGASIRTQYLQMANTLKDKKTRNIALKDVSRIDAGIAQKMAELRDASDIATAAGDRQKRILPEFAGGHYFADYFKPNGLLPGMFDGKDNILSLLSRGEMVLNPNQQSRVRSAAGYDVFATAGIPNYPKANPSPRLAMGGITGGGITLKSESPTILVQPNLTFFAEGMTFGENAALWVSTDGGKRTLVNLIIEEKKGNSKL